MPSTQDAGTLFAISIVVLATAIVFNRISLLPTHGYAFAILHFLSALLCCLSSCLAGIIPGVVVTSIWVFAAAGALLRLSHADAPSPPPPRPGKRRILRKISDAAAGTACRAPVYWLPAESWLLASDRE